MPVLLLAVWPAFADEGRTLTCRVEPRITILGGR